MATTITTLNARLLARLRALGALVRDGGTRSEAGSFCCGVRFDRARTEDDMPTPGSCCGVRV